jgi:hypothetical protein
MALRQDTHNVPQALMGLLLFLSAVLFTFKEASTTRIAEQID